MTRFRKIQFKAKSNGFIVERANNSYYFGRYEVYKVDAEGNPIHNTVDFCRNLNEVEQVVKI